MYSCARLLLNNYPLLLVLLLSVMPFTPSSAASDGLSVENVARMEPVNPPAHELSPDDAREDLTVFFAIGVVVDILLVTAFLVWAVGQWRKPRK